ncbi:MAG: hypothetical protein E7170_04640 [Firmicutes bacterium]|nr:hypothetical protein [Bacillota bacterium]
MKDITIVDKKFKLCKNNHKAVNIKKEDIEKGTLFVSCGVDTGAILGRVNMVGVANKEYIADVNSGNVMAPIVVFCQTISQANKMFENLKNDSERFNNLAVEVQREEMMNNARQLQEEHTLTETKQKEQGKRLALNNGIFKPSDFQKNDL